MARYTPLRLDEPEFERLSQAMSAPDDYLVLNKLDKLPAKYKEGYIIFVSAALSTTLGLAGIGFYGYHSGTWNKLG